MYRNDKPSSQHPQSGNTMLPSVLSPTGPAVNEMTYSEATAFMQAHILPPEPYETPDRPISLIIYSPKGSALSIHEDLVLRDTLNLSKFIAYIQALLDKQFKGSMFVRTIEIRVGTSQSTQGFPPITGDLVGPHGILPEVAGVDWCLADDTTQKEIYWKTCRVVMQIGGDNIIGKPIMKVRTVYKNGSASPEKAKAMSPMSLAPKSGHSLMRKDTLMHSERSKSPKQTFASEIPAADAHQRNYKSESSNPFQGRSASESLNSFQMMNFSGSQSAFQEPYRRESSSVFQGPGSSEWPNAFQRRSASQPLNAIQMMGDAASRNRLSGPAQPPFQFGFPAAGKEQMLNSSVHTSTPTAFRQPKDSVVTMRRPGEEKKNTTLPLSKLGPPEGAPTEPKAMRKPKPEVKQDISKEDVISEAPSKSKSEMKEDDLQESVTLSPVSSPKQDVFAGLSDIFQKPRSPKIVMRDPKSKGVMSPEKPVAKRAEIKKDSALPILSKRNPLFTQQNRVETGPEPRKGEVPPQAPARESSLPRRSKVEVTLQAHPPQVEPVPHQPRINSPLQPKEPHSQLPASKLPQHSLISQTQFVQHAQPSSFEQPPQYSLPLQQQTVRRSRPKSVSPRKANSLLQAALTRSARSVQSSLEAASGVKTSSHLELAQLAQASSNQPRVNTPKLPDSSLNARLTLQQVPAKNSTDRQVVQPAQTRPKTPTFEEIFGTRPALSERSLRNIQSFQQGQAAAQIYTNCRARALIGSQQDSHPIPSELTPDRILKEQAKREKKELIIQNLLAKMTAPKAGNQRKANASMQSAASTNSVQKFGTPYERYLARQNGYSKQYDQIQHAPRPLLTGQGINQGHAQAPGHFQPLGQAGVPGYVQYQFQAQPQAYPQSLFQDQGGIQTQGQYQSQGLPQDYAQGQIYDQGQIPNQFQLPAQGQVANQVQDLAQGQFSNNTAQVPSQGLAQAPIYGRDRAGGRHLSRYHNHRGPYQRSVQEQYQDRFVPGQGQFGQGPAVSGGGQYMVGNQPVGAGMHFQHQYDSNHHHQESHQQEPVYPWYAAQVSGTIADVNPQAASFDNLATQAAPFGAPAGAAAPTSFGGYGQNFRAGGVSEQESLDPQFFGLPPKPKPAQTVTFPEVPSEPVVDPGRVSPAAPSEPAVSNPASDAEDASDPRSSQQATSSQDAYWRAKAAEALERAISFEDDDIFFPAGNDM